MLKSYFLKQNDNGLYSDLLKTDKKNNGLKGEAQFVVSQDSNQVNHIQEYLRNGQHKPYQEWIYVRF